MEPLLVRAARREPVERTPVWFMRQAGRSLPEYRAIRERHSFFEVAGTPELCAEVTLQPVRRHGVDAAVMFADIMSPVLGMGVAVELVEGVGPVVERRIESAADVERMRVTDPEEWAAPILEAVRIVRAELEPERAVVGFCGGPFTVAGYLVEGRPSRDFVRTKSLMYGEPEVWHALMERLTEQFSRYVAAKAAAGADAIQLFDSWVGALSPADYAEFVAPYSARILAAVDVPTIHFGTGASTPLLALLAATGGDVLGLDWRVPLDAGWEAAGEDRGVQGNLDPALLLGPWERVEAGALDVLARAGGRPGHIFNLGHGVLPQTDPDVLGRLVELVHAPVGRLALPGQLLRGGLAVPRRHVVELPSVRVLVVGERELGEERVRGRATVVDQQVLVRGREVELRRRDRAGVDGDRPHPRRVRDEPRVPRLLRRVEDVEAEANRPRHARNDLVEPRRRCPSRP